MKDSYIFYKDKLGKEYLAVFEQVELYVLSQNVDESAIEERLGELLDIFLSTEAAGKPVQKIVGNDLERFCKTFCSDFGWKNRILSIVDRFKTIAWLLLVLSFLDMTFFIEDTLESGGGDFWKGAASVNLSGYMMGILAAWVLAAIFNAALCQIMFKTKRVSMKILRAASCIGAILGFLIILWFLSRDETILFFCPAWVMFAASGVYLLLYYILCRKRVKRQKVKFLDLIKDEVREEFPNEMEKKFEKAKRKSLRKGKGELSLEAFLEKEEKDVRLTEKMDIFYYVLPLVITAGGFIPTYLNDGFESFLDTIIYVVVMLAVEYPLMLAFAKIGKNGTRERKRWIAAKREEMKQGEMEKEEVR